MIKNKPEAMGDMKFVIAHRTVSGVYLCHEGIHWYWGPRELAKEYTADMAKDLIRSYPRWEFLLGVSQDEALIEIDRTPVTVAPKAGTYAQEQSG